MHVDMTEICQYLRNWFTKSKLYADFVVRDGVCYFSDGSDLPVVDGQFYRIVGSSINAGVHRAGDYSDVLQDEQFNGAIWTMAVPQAVVNIARDISQWREKYENVDSQNMSPFSSESFNNYSYSKAQGFANVGGGMLNTWQAIYGPRLAPWRKI